MTILRVVSLFAPVVGSEITCSKLLPVVMTASRDKQVLTVPPVKKDLRVSRNWADLPEEFMSSILQRHKSIEILENAQVCKLWRRVCKDPSLWRKIDMPNLGELEDMDYDLKTMCEHAVDLSQGGLSKVNIWYFGTDHLLNYIADSSSNLRSLKLIMCKRITDEGFVKAVVKLSLPEEVEISYCSLSAESLKVLGQSCPNMKILNLNDKTFRRPRDMDDNKYKTDNYALAIAESMPQLCHLELIGSGLSDTGLNVILDNLHHLQHLDLRRCFDILFEGCLEQKSLEKVKELRHPNDSLPIYSIIVRTCFNVA